MCVENIISKHQLNEIMSSIFSTELCLTNLPKIAKKKTSRHRKNKKVEEQKTVDNVCIGKKSVKLSKLGDNSQAIVVQREQPPPEIEDDVQLSNENEESIHQEMALWSRLQVPVPILRALRDLNFKEPTDIQVAAIPVAIRDRLDILGAAQTGSGKTLAFGIPLINHVMTEKAKDNAEQKLRGLIMTPTRELAVQIRKHLEQLTKYTDVSVMTIVGGLAQGKQERLLKKQRPDIVVATPGRLWELIDSFGQTYLNRESIRGLQFLVLDEADRLTEKGHFEELAKVIMLMKMDDDEEEHLEGVIDDGDAFDFEAEAVKIEEVTSDDYYGRKKKALLDKNNADEASTEFEEVNIDLEECNDAESLNEDGSGIDSDVSEHEGVDENDIADYDNDISDGEVNEENNEVLSAKKIPLKRQILVFSATLTLVHELPQRFQMKKTKKFKKPTVEGKLKNLITMLGMRLDKSKVIDHTEKGIGRPDQERLKETCIVCPKTEKDLYLYYFLALFPGRTMIFCNNKDCIRRLTSVLRLLTFAPQVLHADLDQKKRLQALERFAAVEGEGLLLATDVAARGLDIRNVDHVVHYQSPRTSESYVHRSGRTARGFESGVTLVLVEPGEGYAYNKLCKSVNDGKHLDNFPVDEEVMKVIKARVKLAQEIDVFEHQINKRQFETNWLKRAAREMEMDISDDDEFILDSKCAGRGKKKKGEDDPIEARAQERHELKYMKKELQKLLKQPLGSYYKKMLRQLITGSTTAMATNVDGGNVQQFSNPLTCIAGHGGIKTALQVISASHSTNRKKQKLDHSNKVEQKVGSGKKSMKSKKKYFIPK